MLNVNHSCSFFSTPGGILYVSHQLSMPTISSQSVAKPNGTSSAGSTRSISNFVKAHLGLMMLNSFYALMMICLFNDVSLNPGPVVLQSTNLPTIRGFKISHLNVRSITHKMDLWYFYSFRNLAESYCNWCWDYHPWLFSSKERPNLSWWGSNNFYTRRNSF